MLKLTTFVDIFNLYIQLLKLKGQNSLNLEKFETNVLVVDKENVWVIVS